MLLCSGLLHAANNLLDRDYLKHFGILQLNFLQDAKKLPKTYKDCTSDLWGLYTWPDHWVLTETSFAQISSPDNHPVQGQRHHQQKPQCTMTKAYFYWVTREQGSFDWFRGVMKDVEENDQKVQSGCPLPME